MFALISAMLLIFAVLYALTKLIGKLPVWNQSDDFEKEIDDNAHYKFRHGSIYIGQDHHTSFINSEN